MKINWIEKLIEKGLVKSYYYSYSDDGKLLFVDINTGRSILLENNLRTIQRYAKKNNARLRYIGTYSENGFIYQKLTYIME